MDCCFLHVSLTVKAPTLRREDVHLVANLHGMHAYAFEQALSLCVQLQRNALRKSIC